MNGAGNSSGHGRRHAEPDGLARHGRSLLIVNGRNDLSKSRPDRIQHNNDARASKTYKIASLTNESDDSADSRVEQMTYVGARHDLL